MKLLNHFFVLCGICLVHGKEDVEEKNITVPANKTSLWSQPDLSTFPLPVETRNLNPGFSATPITDSSYGQADPRSIKPFFPADLTRSKDEESKMSSKEPKADVTNPQLKSEPEGPKTPYEFLKSLHQNHKHAFFHPGGLNPQPNKVVFEGNGGYKPIKFEDDFPSTRFAPDHFPGKEIVHSSSHPYPYQYVRGFADGASDPLPTASGSQPISLHRNVHGIHPGPINHIHKGGLKKKSVWDKVVRVLAAFIPLGLFLAALPPNVLTINSTHPTTIGRQRSNDEEPHALMDLFERFGFDSLEQEDCESRVFCEIAKMGSTPTSNVLQQSFWQLANDVPDNMSQAVGFKEIFTAIRGNTCHMFKCPEKKKITNERKRNLAISDQSQYQ